MHLLGGVTACAAFGGASFPQSSSRSAVRMHQPSQHTQPPAWLGQLVAPALIAGVSLLGGADAALAKEMTPDQELVAQAWYKTNLNFVDRSFADQDWFSLRQKMVKKKYDSRDEAYVEIRSMLATLDDKYTRFLTPSMFKAIYAVATGDVAGIGVELAAVDAVGGMTGGRGSEGADVKITAIVEGAPSEKAGLQIGDVLVDADGNNLAGLSPEEAAAKVRGPVGSRLRLVVKRPGEEENRVVLITRASVKLEAVTSTMVGKTGYVRIKQFSTTTAADVKNALDAMSGAKAFVLDLRGNTGGYFPGGVDVARLFLKAEQAITFVVDKRLIVTDYRTFEDGPYVNTPLLLLVDGNTASASEVLSSALQDNGRTQLAGTKTFGKAVIQTVEELDDGSAIVVTIAKYQTPKKTDINKIGISVDLQRDNCPPVNLGAKALETCVADDVKKLLAS